MLYGLEINLIDAFQRHYCITSERLAGEQLQSYRAGQETDDANDG